MATTLRTSEAAKQLKASALYAFKNHGHNGYWDALTRENCGACTLGGYGEFSEEGQSLQPNHSGWQRLYVQAGRPIPKKYREAFEDGRVDRNTGYAAQLAIDIATFGVTFE